MDLPLTSDDIKNSSLGCELMYLRHSVTGATYYERSQVLLHF